MAFQAMLNGGAVVDEGGEEIDISSITPTGGVIAIYFSAHWCPPCRSFTPNLAEWYNKVKATEHGSKFEIVFASSDRDEDAFNNYFKDMPWKALRYSDRDAKEKLSKKFKVSGIPSLIFIEADTGKIISKDGRNIVSTSDKNGDGFPWKPMTLADALSGQAVLNDGTTVAIDDVIKGKILGLYFSAHWCPPCRGFTPKLVATYNKVVEAGKNFEVLFVSGDKDEKSFKEYHATMPWPALALDDKKAKNALNGIFEVEGIPSLVLLDENRKVITKSGRAAIDGDADGEAFPWIPSPLQELSGACAGSLNETASLIYLTDVKEELMVAAQAAMIEVATDDVKKQQEDEEMEEIMFCYESAQTDDLADSVRKFVGLKGDAVPALLLLNIPEGEKYVVEKDEITKDDVEDVIKRFREGTLEMKSLPRN